MTTSTFRMMCIITITNDLQSSTYCEKREDTTATSDATENFTPSSKSIIFQFYPMKCHRGMVARWVYVILNSSKILIYDQNVIVQCAVFNVDSTTINPIY